MAAIDSAVFASVMAIIPIKAIPTVAPKPPNEHLDTITEMLGENAIEHGAALKKFVESQPDQIDNLILRGLFAELPCHNPAKFAEMLGGGHAK